MEADGSESNVGFEWEANSSHFILFIIKAIYILVRGKYDSQMALEILIHVI